MMRYVCPAIAVALLCLGPAWMAGQAPATVFVPPTDSTIGMNLEASGMVTLNGPVSAAGVDVTLTSNDPSKLVLSTKPDTAGSASIVVRVSMSSREAEFFMQALDKSGTATYTIATPGVTSVTGKVTLAPSGIVIGGPFGAGSPHLRTTTGAPKSKINVYTALLDPSLNYIARQRLAGGRSVEVNLVNANPAVGKLDSSTVKIAGGSNNAFVQFQPATEGETTLKVSVPSGFSAPPQELYNTVTAKVEMPSLIVAEEFILGQNLQDAGVIGLNEPAPKGGLEITVTCKQADKLLFSASPTEKGSNPLKLKVPAGAVQIPYYLQALGGEGEVTYVATAPGHHASRTTTVKLWPSGVIVTGPLSFTRAGGSPGFVANLATHKPTIVTVYTVFLNPVTHKSTDVMVQPLRAGLSLTAELKSSDPSIGAIGSSVTIKGPGNQASTEFVPLKLGTTVVSVVTPKGYTESSNATTLKCIVISE